MRHLKLRARVSSARAPASYRRVKRIEAWEKLVFGLAAGCAQVEAGLYAFRRTVSTGCRMTASADYQQEWRRRRREARRQVCFGCRQEFAPARKAARFCPPACRFKAYRARLAAKEAEARRVADLIAKARDRAFALIG